MQLNHTYRLYWVPQFKLPSHVGVTELIETKKKLMSTYGLSSKLKWLLAHEISKFMKIRKFQKKLYANLRLLNVYELIISKTNKKAYVVVCSIFKIGDAISTQTYYFPIFSAPFHCMH